MIIPVHHEEEIPVMNCGEGYVFAKYGANAWVCMTKEEYAVKQEHNNQIGQYIGFGFIGAIILSFIIAYFIVKYED